MNSCWGGSWQLLEARSAVLLICGFSNPHAYVLKRIHRLFLRSAQSDQTDRPEMYTFEGHAALACDCYYARNTASVVRPWNKLYGVQVPAVLPFYIHYWPPPGWPFTSSTPSSASIEKAPRTQLSMRSAAAIALQTFRELGLNADLVLRIAPSLVCPGVPSIYHDSSFFCPARQDSALLLCVCVCVASMNIYGKEPLSTRLTRLQGDSGDDANGRTCSSLDKSLRLTTETFPWGQNIGGLLGIPLLPQPTAWLQWPRLMSHNTAFPVMYVRSFKTGAHRAHSLRWQPLQHTSSKIQGVKSDLGINTTISAERLLHDAPGEGGNSTTL